MADAVVPPVRDCFPPTDADLLGLGVRLGAYLQALSAILNLVLDADQAPGDMWMQLFTALPITAAALHYILRQTISNAVFLATAYIGWVQMVTLPVGLLLPSVLEHTLLWTIAFMATLWVNGLYIWYWAVGFDAIDWKVCPQTFAFFFARVEAFGWFRVVTLVALCLTAIVNVIFLLPVFGGVKAAQGALQSHAEQGRLARYRALVRGYVLFTFLFVVWLIIGTELTLVWNGVTDVYSLASTGQQIALMLGVGTFVRVWYFSWHRAGRNGQKGLVRVRTWLMSHSATTASFAHSSLASYPEFPSYKEDRPERADSGLKASPGSAKAEREQQQQPRLPASDEGGGGV